MAVKRRTALSAILLLAVCLAAFAGAALADGAPDASDIESWYALQKNDIDRRLEEISAEKDHPCVYVTTLDGQAILSRDQYVPAMIDVFNCEEEFRLTAPGGIRVRGNSTAEQGDEKPYRIKFEKKQNMLGLHDGRAYKSWVLLRSYRYLAPDYMAFNLAEAIFGGKYYSSDCVYVNLYLNGQHAGVYVLCEQNQAAKGRISVNEPEEGDERTDVGYLVEMDNYVSDEHPWFTIPQKPAVTDIAGETRVIHARDYSIKSDTWSYAQEFFIWQYTKGVFTILYEAAVNDRPMMLDEHNSVVPADGVYQTGFEAVDSVMDLESLADMLILEELVQNYDVGAGSFYMAVDFSENSIYPKLTFLGPWDFNWSYREDPTKNYYASTFQKPMQGMEMSNGWFVLAMKIDEFRDIVTEKWETLSESGVLEEVVGRVRADCESLAGDLGPDIAKLELAEYIADFVLKRIDWLNNEWN